MTSAMTKSINRPAAIRVLPPLESPEQAARRRAKRWKALRNTILEALTTIGLGTCFILCAVMLLCAV